MNFPSKNNKIRMLFPKEILKMILEKDNFYYKQKLYKDISTKLNFIFKNKPLMDIIDTPHGNMYFQTRKYQKYIFIHMYTGIMCTHTFINKETKYKYEYYYF